MEQDDAHDLMERLRAKYTRQRPDVRTGSDQHDGATDVVHDAAAQSAAGTGAAPLASVHGLCAACHGAGRVTEAYNHRVLEVRRRGTGVRRSDGRVARGGRALAWGAHARNAVPPHQTHRRLRTHNPKTAQL